MDRRHDHFLAADACGKAASREHAPHRGPRLQRGMGALTVCVLLLVAGAIVVFYLNRGLVFEQRASANGLRSTTAFEQAEAGLEWALGMLNNPQHTDTDCAVPAGAGSPPSFRLKYVPTVGSSLAPTDRVMPGCTFVGGGLRCSCPDVPGAGIVVASLGTVDVAPGFTVSFATVPRAGGPGGLDPDSVAITAVGCSGVAGACTSTTAAGSDATASATVIVKLEPVFRTPPAAALTCGGATCSLGAATIQNMDVATNGVTIDAAADVAVIAPTTQLVTIAGLPPENSVIAKDSALKLLADNDAGCAASALFRGHFGSTLESYANAPTVKSVRCPTGSGCPALTRAYAQGWRSFYLPDGLQLDGTTSLGSATDPVLLVSPAGVALNDTAAVQGLVYGQSATLAGAPNVRGALLACTAFTGDPATTGRITYEPDILQTLQRGSRVMLRVPGSWRDFPPPPAP